MIHVVAIVTTQPGQRERVLKLFRANAVNVRAENGCLEYEAAIDWQHALAAQTEVGADTFFVIEKWESIKALQAHFDAPHMAAYAGKVRDLVATRTIHILSPV